jgi:hypothetical protein
MNILKLPVFIGLMCFAIAFTPATVSAAEPQENAVPRTPSDYASLEKSLLRTKEAITPSVHLDKRLISTRGPIAIKSFQMEADAENEYMWIRRFKIDILDEAGEVDSAKYLCHAWLMGDTGRLDPTSGEIGARKGKDPSLFLTISPGLMDLQFPEGFAVGFESSGISRYGLLAQSVNNSFDPVDKDIRFRATIDYLDDESAQQLGIKPLTGFQLHANQDLEKLESLHPHYTEMQEHHHSSSMSSMHSSEKEGAEDHWVVPPGRQVLRSEVEPGAIEFDGMIHAIKVHLHPFGESIALIDKATGEEIWKGRATNHPNKSVPELLNIESYSSSTGIPVYKDREYELVTIYDNTTDEAVDAMGVIRLYVHPM